MNSTSLTWLVVVIVIAVLGGWYFLSMNPAVAPAPTGQTQTNQNPNGPDYSPNGTPGSTAAGVSGNTTVNIDVSTSNAPMSATVTYSASGFSPSPVTIKKGGTVTFVDSNPNGDMWVASGQHPEHTGYDGTTREAHCAAGYTGSTPFDQCKAGSSYTFTFGKVGTWPYHNHLNTSAFGQVIIVE